MLPSNFGQQKAFQSSNTHSTFQLVRHTVDMRHQDSLRCNLLIAQDANVDGSSGGRVGLGDPQLCNKLQSWNKNKDSWLKIKLTALFSYLLFYEECPTVGTCWGKLDLAFPIEICFVASDKIMYQNRIILYAVHVKFRSVNGLSPVDSSYNMEILAIKVQKINGHAK